MADTELERCCELLRRSLETMECDWQSIEYDRGDCESLERAIAQGRESTQLIRDVRHYLAGCAKEQG